MQEISGPWLRRAAGPLASWLRTAPGFSAEEGIGWWRVGCDGAKPDMNCLSLTGEGASAADALSEGFESVLRMRRSAVICVAAEQAASIVGMMSTLPVRSAGMLPHYLIALSEFEPARTQTGAKIDQVKDVAGFCCAMGVLTRAFDDPYDDPNGAFGPGLLDDPLFTFRVARMHETPASVVVTWREVEIVYVTIMATDPRFQGKGIGRQLIEQALIEERETGATHAHLVSSEAGARLYRSVGFQLLANHPLWLYEGTP